MLCLPAGTSEQGSLRNPATHRLKRARLIRPLFDRARPGVEQVSTGCVRILFRPVRCSELPAGVRAQAGVAVGRRHGSAATRNRIRRLLRESYRHSRTPMLDALARTDSCLTLMLLYRGGGDIHTRSITPDMRQALLAVTSRIGRAHQPS